jgi:tripartite-type tricarboxylate transporter receptor subunit TctC
MLAPPAAFAQQDSRAVRIVVPAPAGGSMDGTARVLAQRMSALTGEPHVVENRPGANTVIGVEHVVRSQPDGRTLLFTGPSVVTNALLQKLPYVPLDDLRPVMAIGAEHYVLLAAAHLKASSIRELAAIAAARPGGLNCGTPPGPVGFGCEQLKARLNGALVSVPYPGIAPTLAALGGGHVDVSFIPRELAGKLIDAKLANELAVSHRAATQSDAGGVPALSEVWPGFVLEGLVGVYVPARMPEERVRELHRQLSQVMSEPETLRRIQTAGLNPLPPHSPEVFTRRVRELFARYEQVARRLGLAAP